MLFRTSEGHAACSVHLHAGVMPKLAELGHCGWAFRSSVVWAAFRWERGWGFVCPAYHDEAWQRLLLWAPATGQADLWLGPEESVKDPLQNLTLPFFTALFAHYGGVLVHAAAVDLGGKAWILVGPSGRGKSHWTQQLYGKGLKVLDEDRTVLRVCEGQVWAFGTPWHAEPRLCSPDGAPVERLLFLQEAAPNTIEEARPTTATTLLLRASLLPIYDPSGTRTVLEVICRTALQSRSFRLGYDTDELGLKRLESIQ